MVLQLHPEDSRDGDHFKGEQMRWRDIAERLIFSPVNILLEISETHSLNMPLTGLEVFPFVRNIRSVSIGITTNKNLEWEKKLRDRILLTSAPSLVELKFRCTPGYELSPLSGVVFPKLRKLETDCGWEPGSKALKIIGNAITESFPAL